MIKNFFLLFLLFITSASFAQFKIGIMGGPQSSGIKEKTDIPATGKYYSNRTGFHIGLMAEIPLSAKYRLYFQPAVLYSEKGNKYSKKQTATVTDTVFFFNTAKSVTLRYADIPLNIAYKLPIKGRKAYNVVISAGPYVSLFCSGNRTVSQNDQFSTHTETVSTVVNKTEPLKAGTQTDNYRSVAYGFNTRAGLESGKVSVTVFYSQGLDNLYYAAYPATFKHKVFGLSVGIWLDKKIKPRKDTDNDGVADKQDACPLEAGLLIANGCPDMDADGVNDRKDLCPEVAGLVKYNGCPVAGMNSDSLYDADVSTTDTIIAVTDSNKSPATVTARDSTNKEAVTTPNENQHPADSTTMNNLVAEKNEKDKQDSENIENIIFATNSAKLFPQSIKSLKQLVRLLREKPALTLTVDGYTDNTGTDKINNALAVRRAQAVKRYLITKGISANRIRTNAFGDNNAVAENTTADGRSKNRRAELTLRNEPSQE